MSKKCYVCSKPVSDKLEQNRYLDLCNTDNEKSWDVANRYGLEWTYHGQPTDTTKYIIDPNAADKVDYNYSEIVCNECIDLVLNPRPDQFMAVYKSYNISARLDRIVELGMDKKYMKVVADDMLKVLELMERVSK